ncbi:MAG: hypothetical protein MJY75_04185 [Bacteroidaceae bacterium]|nr:hypothetical protein [Bacteroidaceae bacterium]
MKKTAIAMALLAVTVTAGAQRNDLYSSGTKSKTVSTTASSSVTRVPVQADAFDTDNYNRRYTSSYTTSQYEEPEYSNTVYIHDTVFYMMESESRQSLDSYSYNEGYTDAIEDFYATRLITRFHRRGLTLSLALDPFFHDYLYWDTWYYDPWYYDSYYYRYSYRYYDRYYYYEPRYRYISSYRPSYRYDRHYASAPSRSVSSSRGGGWDRNLNGRSVRSTRTLASGSGRVSEPSRTVSTRSVGAQHSAERRGVQSVSVNRNTSGATTPTRSSNSQSSGYDRPSSTGSVSVTRSSSPTGTRSVTRSVSGNGSRSTGTGSRGEAAHSTNQSDRSTAGRTVSSSPSNGTTRSVSSGTTRSVSSSPSSRSTSSSSVSRSVSSGSSSRSVSSGGVSRSVSSGSPSRGASGSGSRR